MLFLKVVKRGFQTHIQKIFFRPSRVDGRGRAPLPRPQGLAAEVLGAGQATLRAAEAAAAPLLAAARPLGGEQRGSQVKMTPTDPQNTTQIEPKEQTCKRCFMMMNVM